LNATVPLKRNGKAVKREEKSEDLPENSTARVRMPYGMKCNSSARISVDKRFSASICGLNQGIPGSMNNWSGDFFLIRTATHHSKE